MATRDRRKVGDTSPFSVTVDFGETVNLAPLTKRFTLYDLALANKIVDGATAEATDVTSEVAGPSAPLLSVWEIFYEPTSGEVSVKGDYLGLFSILYAGGAQAYYPGEDEYIVVEISGA